MSKPLTTFIFPSSRGVIFVAGAVSTGDSDAVPPFIVGVSAPRRMVRPA